ncbi:DUF5677 domain-containing protein [Natrialba hulunbeirensis]|uniref:DUF5677 domain-containing protein n=1 Tax=Natrialba hulunbeirensis TaxID=123783 RepID=UPI001269444F|nr:DUF5677 domain-containing protein [Natrialba hulunbeirensis]
MSESHHSERSRVSKLISVGKRLITNWMVPKISAEILLKTKFSGTPPLYTWKEEMGTFNQRLYETWEKPFDQFQRYLIGYYSIGGDIQKEAKKKQTPINEDYLSHALILLYSRSCLIGREIFTLLKNGYADGALARWRALHEVTVTTAFIYEHGDEVAERYLKYKRVQDHREAEIYDQYYQDLGFDPYPEELFDKLDQEKNELRDEYGNPIDDKGYGWGWAAEEFSNKSASFKQIQEEAGYDHLYPFYKYASNTIHGGPKGTLYRIGTPSTSESPLTAGPSNTGFTDPAQLTIFSLLDIAAIMVDNFPSKKRQMILFILKNSADEIILDFNWIQNHIEKQER